MKILSLPLLLGVLIFPCHGWTVENPETVLSDTNHNLLSLLYQLQPEMEMPTISGNQFLDVSLGSWQDTAAQYVVSHQIMSGTSAHEFSPQGAVTRGFVSTVITNSAHADLGASPNVFSDVSGQWYRDSVNWCAQQEIMAGYTENYFAGNHAVTVEVWAVILYQYGLYLDIAPQNPNQTALSSYTHQKNISSYAKNAMAWCLQEELLHVDEEIPTENVTRAQVAYGIMMLEGLEGFHH